MDSSCPSCNSKKSTEINLKCFCGHSFNHFNDIGRCPACNYTHEFTECYECEKISLHLDWYNHISLDQLKSELQNGLFA